MTLGSIPAWAGEPPQSAPPRWCDGVYPRVGGGTRLRLEGAHHLVGLSPRGRGNHLRHLYDHIAVGSIPAWAGEPVISAVEWRSKWVYPRVGGGTGWGVVRERARPGLSPRGRGNRRLRKAIRALVRSIPAWAGEPGGLGYALAEGGVYPRVGGGTSVLRSSSPLRGGLSPRGRGNRIRSSHR